MSLIRPQLEAPVALPESEVRARSIFRQAVFVAILLVVYISTRPYYVQPEGTILSSDPLNQVAFLGLACLAVIGLIMADHRAMLPVLQPSYALLFLLMGSSVVMSTQFGISFRAFGFTAIVMFLAASLYAMPERFSQFQKLLLLSALGVMAFSYFGIIALPDSAKHTDFDPFEPEHAGSWKGHFDHKNIAGATMGCFAIMGLYALRIGKNWIGAILLIGGFLFVYFTKSKTSLALLPLAMLLGILAERIPSLILRLLICLTPVFTLISLTIGGVLVPWISAMNKAVMKDPTFTGRFDIWRYGFEMLAQRPWQGYGFEGFWQTSTTLQGESRLELAWAVEKIIHGHNSYLDVALTLGVPGLLLVLYIFVVKPVLDYHACQPTDENRKIATMFLTIILFVSLGMCLETYYFRRSDPVWFTLLIAVIGLRFTAAYRFDQSPSPGDPAPARAG